MESKKTGEVIYLSPQETGQLHERLAARGIEIEETADPLTDARVTRLDHSVFISQRRIVNRAREKAQRAEGKGQHKQASKRVRYRVR